MRNRISGIVGVVWGGFIISSPLRRTGDAAYDAGQTIGFLIGGLMLAAGIYYLFLADGPSAKKKKKKKNNAKGFRPPAPPSPPHEI